MQSWNINEIMHIKREKHHPYEFQGKINYIFFFFNVKKIVTIDFLEDASLVIECWEIWLTPEVSVWERNGNAFLQNKRKKSGNGN